MKTSHHKWNAQEHRRYLETWLAGIPPIISATSKPLACLAVIVAMISGQPDKWIVYLLRLF